MPKYKHEAKSRLQEGIVLSPIEIIMKFLLKKGRSTRGPIEKHLVEQTGKRYSDHKGLDCILDKMIKMGFIRKLSKGLGRPYPEYEITPEGIDDIGLEADTFASDASHELLNYGRISSGTPASLLEELVRKIGVYTTFAYLQAWKRTSTTNSREINTDSVNAWLNHVRSMRSLSIYFENLTDYLNSHQNRKAYIFEDENKKKILEMLEKELEKIYPSETGVCKTILEKTSCSVKQSKDDLRDIMELEKWVKLQEKRNKKFPKKKIKPNECPRCHYDGTRSVPHGPSRGKIIKNSFAWITFEDRKVMHCAVCGFRQEIKGS